MVEVSPSRSTEVDEDVVGGSVGEEGGGEGDTETSAGSKNDSR